MGREDLVHSEEDREGLRGDNGDCDERGAAAASARGSGRAAGLSVMASLSLTVLHYEVRCCGRSQLLPTCCCRVAWVDRRTEGGRRSLEDPRHNSHVRAGPALAGPSAPLLHCTLSMHCWATGTGVLVRSGHALTPCHAHGCVEALHDMPRGARSLITPHPQGQCIGGRQNS